MLTSAMCTSFSEYRKIHTILSLGNYNITGNYFIILKTEQYREILIDIPALRTFANFYIKYKYFI